MQLMTRPHVLRATTYTLSWSAVDSDGEAGADPGTVTIEVTSSDGTAVVAAGSATTGTGTSPRTKALTAAQTANLDVLTVTWSSGGIDLAETSIDIVGGYFFTVAELRAAQPTVIAAKFEAADVIAARAEVEGTFESIQNVSWVPRFDTYRMTGSFAGSQIPLPRPYLRSVRWVRLWTTPTTYFSLSADQCAAIPPSDPGVVELWPYIYGPFNSCAPYGVEIGYENGVSAPPFDVKQQSMRYCRAILNQPTEPVRAQPVLTEDGPAWLNSNKKYHPTGIDEVDEVLLRPSLNFTRPGP